MTWKHTTTVKITATTSAWAACEDCGATGEPMTPWSKARGVCRTCRGSGLRATHIQGGEEEDEWECVCGNATSHNGFYACDTSGRLAEAGHGTDLEDEPNLSPEKWDGIHWSCGLCKRIIDQRDSRIVGMTKTASSGLTKRDLPIHVPRVLHEVLQHLSSQGHKGLVVGGAVRDALLGQDPKDLDVECYGPSYEELADTLSKHGKVNLVGKAFGVAKLRDTEGNEYDFSLPRRDSKTGVGHKDFETEVDPSIHPKEAAARRDFTINSMAWDPLTKELHDYHGGEKDLKNKVLRHTSEAFSEDPLRVLRGMQFSARYGMTVHPDTAKLAKSISHEYSTIPTERVSEEFMKLGKAKEPGRALDYLHETGWSEHFPALHAMKGTPQDTEWHPEGDLHEHTKHTMNAAAKIADRDGLTGDDRTTALFAGMLHDVGKPSTTKVWPHGYRRPQDPSPDDLKYMHEHHMVDRETITSHGHDTAGEPIAREFLDSIGVKREITDKVAPLVREHMQHLNYEKDASPRTVRRLAERLHPATIKELAGVMEADHSGRPPLEGGLPQGARNMLATADESHVVDRKQRPLVQGRDVMPYFNNEPGPHIGEHVKAAYEAQLNGEINTPEEGQAWLRKRFSTKTSHIRDDNVVFKVKVKNLYYYRHCADMEKRQGFGPPDDHGHGRGPDDHRRACEELGQRMKAGYDPGPIVVSNDKGYGGADQWKVYDGMHRSYAAELAGIDEIDAVKEDDYHHTWMKHSDKTSSMGYSMCTACKGVGTARYKLCGTCAGKGCSDCQESGLQMKEMCQGCKGSGLIPYVVTGPRATHAQCTKCGQLWELEEDLSLQSKSWLCDCSNPIRDPRRPEPHESGRKFWRTCDVCRGTGFYPEGSRKSLRTGNPEEAHEFIPKLDDREDQWYSCERCWGRPQEEIHNNWICRSCSGSGLCPTETVDHDSAKTAMPRDDDFINSLHFEHHKTNQGHAITAWNPGGDAPIATIHWMQDAPLDGPPTVSSIDVEHRYQRHGLGTELLRRAKEMEPNLHHDDTLTADGAGLVRSLGDRPHSPLFEQKTAAKGEISISYVRCHACYGTGARLSDQSRMCGPCQGSGLERHCNACRTRVERRSDNTGWAHVNILEGTCPFEQKTAVAKSVSYTLCNVCEGKGSCACGACNEANSCNGCQGSGLRMRCNRCRTPVELTTDGAWIHTQILDFECPPNDQNQDKYCPTCRHTLDDDGHELHCTNCDWRQIKVGKSDHVKVYRGVHIHDPEKFEDIFSHELGTGVHWTSDLQTAKSFGNVVLEGKVHPSHIMDFEEANARYLVGNDAIDNDEWPCEHCMEAESYHRDRCPKCGWSRGDDADEPSCDQMLPTHHEYEPDHGDPEAYPEMWQAHEDWGENEQPVRPGSLVNLQAVHVNKGSSWERRPHKRQITAASETVDLSDHDALKHHLWEDHGWNVASYYVKPHEPLYRLNEGNAPCKVCDAPMYSNGGNHVRCHFDHDLQKHQDKGAKDFFSESKARDYQDDVDAHNQGHKDGVVTPHPKKHPELTRCPTCLESRGKHDKRLHQDKSRHVTREFPGLAAAHQVWLGSGFNSGTSWPMRQAADSILKGEEVPEHLKKFEPDVRTMIDAIQKSPEVPYALFRGEGKHDDNDHQVGDLVHFPLNATGLGWMTHRYMGDMTDPFHTEGKGGVAYNIAPGAKGVDLSGGAEHEWDQDDMEHLVSDTFRVTHREERNGNTIYGVEPHRPGKTGHRQAHTVNVEFLYKERGEDTDDCTSKDQCVQRQQESDESRMGEPHYTPEEWDRNVEDVRTNGVRAPIHIEVSDNPTGTPFIHFNDGNHRLTWAHEAGVSHIPAEVVWHSPDVEEHPWSQQITASWKDVRDKAVRLRNANLVDITRLDDDIIAADVVGDHHTYQVVLYRQYPGSWAITMWECSCKWGDWAFKRQHTFVGRMCSHALATLYAAHGAEYTKTSGLGQGGWGLCPQCGGKGNKSVDQTTWGCGNCKGSGLATREEIADLLRCVRCDHEKDDHSVGGCHYERDDGKGCECVRYQSAPHIYTKEGHYPRKGHQEMYHVAPSSARQKIEQEGLKYLTVPVGNQGMSATYPDIFVWSDMGSAKAWMDRQADLKSAPHDIWKVDTRGMKVKGDNRWEQIEGEKNMSAHRLVDEVPPERLERIEIEKEGHVPDDAPQSHLEMFKVAPSFARESIQASGFRTGHEPKVYAWSHLEDAQKWHEMVSTRVGKPHDIWKIDTRKLEVTHDDNHAYPGDQWERAHYIAQDHIEPERLELHLPGIEKEASACEACRELGARGVEPLYHVTDAKFRQSILSHGLDPAKGEVWTDRKDYPWSWAFDDQQKAQDLAEGQRKRNAAMGNPSPSSVDIWHIDPTGLKVSPDIHGPYINSFTIHEPVPPKNLHVHSYDGSGTDRGFSDLFLARRKTNLAHDGQPGDVPHLLREHGADPQSIDHTNSAPDDVAWVHEQAHTMAHDTGRRSKVSHEDAPTGPEFSEYLEDDIENGTHHTKLYHATSRANRESIEREGLRKGSYAFSDREYAEDFGGEWSGAGGGLDPDNPGHYRKAWDLWEIDAKDLHQHPDYDWVEVEGKTNDWAHTIGDPVPPEKLRRVKEGLRKEAKLAASTNGKLTFYGANRPITIDVEIAHDATSITQGLMNRPYLGQRSGMVFLYPQPPSYSGFWMMNTLIPLSVAFWDKSGRIIEIKDMEPCPPGTSRCPVYKCSKPYWGAVEVNKGFCRQWQIRPGDRIELDM